MNGINKFRVWDCREKKMTYEGLPHQFDILEAEDGELVYYADNKPTIGFDSGPRFTYMQFTRKKDMAGKEIFAGDILKLCKHHHLCDIGEVLDVTWDDDMAGWLMIGGGSDSVIIGNIFENPELLKESV